MKNPLETPFYYGFDYLRASMVLVVVAIHTKLFGPSHVFGTYYDNNISIINVINLYFLPLAVPVFFLISLFLFIVKTNSDNRYFFYRLRRLAYLYLFWVVLWSMHKGDLTTLFQVLNGGIKSVVVFIVSAGSSAFYFFFSLLVLTALSLLFTKLPHYVWWALGAISVTLLWWSTLTVLNTRSHYWLVAFWNPINFLPYVFVASLAAWHLKNNAVIQNTLFIKITVLFLFLSFIIVSVYEGQSIANAIRLQNHTDSSSFYQGLSDITGVFYTRTSVLIGASLIFLLSFFVHRPPNAWIKVLSDNSLGIYCIHVFVLDAYLHIARVSGGVFYGVILRFVVVLAVSIVLTTGIRRTFKTQLI